MLQTGSHFHWNLQKIAGLLLLIVTLVAGGVFYFEYQIGPINALSPRTVEVDIPIGTSVAQMGKALEGSGLIRRAAYFSVVSRMMGVEGRLRAGYYQFTTGMSIKEIIGILKSGKVATYKLTIPEGLTVKEMAPLIEENTEISAQEFLQAAREYQSDFLPTQVTDVEFLVEGFLFPDTYQIPHKTTASELIDIMVKRFQTLVGAGPILVGEQSLSIYDIVIIASLIEEEAKFDQDRPLVSGVIYNRLDQRMKLQLCASVLYVLGIKKERLSLADTKVVSPYNTYQNYGLPPGPISNPGLASLKAAINPEKSKHLFYFSLPDGTIIYNENYPNHLRDVKKYLD